MTPLSIDVRRKDRTILLAVLVILGIILVATSIRGAFIIDEVNYMVNVVGLREARLTVPGTEGLPPSNELVYFDPEPYNRVVTSTPVVSLAPPLYAPIALPFSMGGWRGLIFLNTLSFLVLALLVFSTVGRLATERSTPWIAVALVLLGGYFLEYAQGVWPHMLSVTLCVAAFSCIVRAWEDERTVFVALGGLLLGIACGVRDQNIFLAGCVGLVLLIWSKRRFRTTGIYAAGLGVPLLASATMNYYRLGIFFPTPKAYAYAQYVATPAESASWLKPFGVFLVKIVDFSAFAWFHDPMQFEDYARESSTGAFLVGGIVKKALIQSSPWVALAIVLGVIVWASPKFLRDESIKPARALSLLVLLPIAAFSMAGFRMDGLCFNQRYLLELVPFAAILVAVCLDGSGIRPEGLVVGVLAGAFAYALLMIVAPPAVVHAEVLRVPLALGGVLILFWFLRSRWRWQSFLGITLGLCIGWAFLVQMVDLAASRQIRSTNAAGLDSLEATLPDHSALFAYWGAQNATAGVMQLGRDVVILNAWADMGKDAPKLKQALQQRGRHIFAYGTGMPGNILDSLRGNDSLTVVLRQPFVLYKFHRTNRPPESPGRASNTNSLP